MTGDGLLRIASQDTLEAVRDRIGETGDAGGTYNSGTLTSKANAALLALGGVNNGIDGLNNRLDGVVTPYGKGTYGDLIVSPDLAWPSQDGFNRYVLHTKSMTIPEGVTLTPPDKCDGLYILSQGDVTINGVIDVRGKRKTFTEDLQLAPTINVGNQEFLLAKGGYSPTGTTSGAGGDVSVSGGLKDTTKYTNSSYEGLPALTAAESIAENINGGGVPTYKTHKDRFVSVIRREVSGSGNHYGYLNMIETPSDASSYTQNFKETIAPGAVVIIAKGKVTINGQILASATDGMTAQNGQDALAENRGTNGDNHYYYYYAGSGGRGAIPPSGGGAVTIICETIEINGSIDTNGKKLVSNDGEKGSDEDGSGSFNTKVTWHAGGGYGGKGGTFISTAGEIKVYTGVSE